MAFSDVLEKEHVEVLCALGDLHKLISALDTIGMSSLANQLWSVYERIKASNDKINDAYRTALIEEFVASVAALNPVVANSTNKS